MYICYNRALVDSVKLSAPNPKNCWSFYELVRFIAESNGESINFGIVRGLDYYSGIVFEVFDKNSQLGALAGGGIVHLTK